MNGSEVLLKEQVEVVFSPCPSCLNDNQTNQPLRLHTAFGDLVLIPKDLLLK